MKRSYFAILAIIVLALMQACSRKSGPPYTPAEEQQTFRLPSGFRMELVAAEPDVIDPVAMTFDEAGRIYAVEMRDYPMGDGPPGRIRLLEDRDGDGRYEHSTVFADNLQLPNGVMRWRKGILVTSTPDILYFEDSDGDGKADKRKVVLTGFASQNPQLRLNGPQYGIDNWIYAAYTRLTTARRYAKEFGDKGQPIRFPDRPDIKPLDIHSRDVRFRPDEGKLEALAGFSQFGWSFNEWADRFVVWNSDHIRHVPLDSATVDRNPNLAIALPMHSASDHKAQATVYPVTENPRHIHDSQIGHFTSSCGLSVYAGANLPPDFQNNSFTCEPVHNLVHRDILTPTGGSFTASRAYQNSEFLASTDAWFRPVFTMTGPDGALYVVDYYRHSVEHPEFVPPELLKDLDFTTKPQKGRIWRVVHESSQKRAAPKLGEATTAQLVEALSDKNLWWRITAQRLLVDRQAKDTAPALEALARNGGTGQSKIHALWTLDGLGLLSDTLISAALSDSHPGVRRHGVKLARKAHQSAVLALAGDANPQVRYEAAISIAAMPEQTAFAPLLKIALADPGDQWLQVVALSNARTTSLRWFEALAKQPKPEVSFVHCAASLIGNRGADPEIAAVIRSGSEPALQGLAEGVAASSSLTGARPQAQAAILGLLANARGKQADAALRIASALRANPAALLANAEKTADNESASVEERTHAAGIIGLATDGRVSRYLAPKYPAEVRVAATRALARLAPDTAAPAFLEQWRALTGPMRETAMAALMKNPKTVNLLLDAVEKNQIQVWAIGQARLRSLQQHSDAAIRERATAVAKAAGGDREDVYKRYLPAVHRDGDPGRGKPVFDRVCADCHELGGVGTAVGPDLRGVVKRYKEVLLANILMPSENIEPGYEEYVVETRDGRVLTGLLSKDTPSSITLRRAKGEEDVVPRSQIKELRSGGTSPMPDGVEKDITVDQMADLIAYLKRPQ